MGVKFKKLRRDILSVPIASCRYLGFNHLSVVEPFGPIKFSLTSKISLIFRFD